MLKAKESSSDLDWGQAMANGADLEWMGRQDVAPQVMLTSYLSVISQKKRTQVETVLMKPLSNRVIPRT